MKRRKFVATSGAALLAGCNEIQGPDPDPDDPRPPENVSEEESPESGPVGDVEIKQFEWIIDGKISQFLLSNVGEAPAGRVTLVVQWFDANGNYIGSDQASLPVLPPQTAWLIEIESSVPFETDSFDGYVEFDPQYEMDDLPVESLDIDQSVPGVTGIAPLDRDSETAIQATVLTFNSGWVTHAGQITENHIPESTNWRFLIPLTQVGGDESSIGDDEIELYFSLLE
ncbi:FxLYD domain-containing protein [Natronomonas salsuginis]|uniref:Uncharacterized protein n=1 Tax=Natronomonas salsuginis TaxID=2217661 RepID=A0A4U5JGG6_9EURY|nr:FxLYD domain-containing protein [Natronomonas salsuginis]TKR27915.1 hypothetical protein DM868_02185 [Natronomonas salsuginis]